MFLHRVGMQRTREIQQKRPAVRNKQAASKVAGRDRTFEKSAVRVFGALTNLTQTLYLNNSDGGTRAVFQMDLLECLLSKPLSDSTSVTPD
jgi:hypothetical protein